MKTVKVYSMMNKSRKQTSWIDKQNEKLFPLSATLKCAITVSSFKPHLSTDCCLTLF